MSVFAVIDVETTTENALLSVGIVIGQVGNPKPIEFFYGVMEDRLKEPAQYKASLGLAPDGFGLKEKPVPEVVFNGVVKPLDKEKVQLLYGGIIAGYEKATKASLYSYNGNFNKLLEDFPVWGGLLSTEHWQHKLVSDSIRTYDQAVSSYQRIASQLGDIPFIFPKKELAVRMRDFLARHRPDTLLAYNATFDQEVIGPAFAKLLPQSDWRDIMQVAKNVKSNPRLKELHPFLNQFQDPNYYQNGNIKTGFGAEAMYRLLFNCSDGTAEPPESDPREVYIESHNALLDALDEFRIFKALMDDPYMYPLTSDIPELPWKGKAPFELKG